MKVPGEGRRGAAAPPPFAGFLTHSFAGGSIVSVHRVHKDHFEVMLQELVRGGERIDSVHLDVDEYVIITEDRVETRPAGDAA
jgi:hypothetical protein